MYSASRAMLSFGTSFFGERGASASKRKCTSTSQRKREQSQAYLYCGVDSFDDTAKPHKIIIMYIELKTTTNFMWMYSLLVALVSAIAWQGIDTSRATVATKRRHAFMCFNSQLMVYHFPPYYSYINTIISSTRSYDCWVYASLRQAFLLAHSVCGHVLHNQIHN